MRKYIKLAIFKGKIPIIVSVLFWIFLILLLSQNLIPNTTYQHIVTLIDALLLLIGATLMIIHVFVFFKRRPLNNLYK
jgi:hypothetical protein